ncbi:MAG: 50S ribosomal protein L9 [Phycisphaerae bacterium]|nr:50S ribosomal protein L9 [Phycisphaerae bacterium]
MMKVLLLKDVRRLGHVGDVVNVATGYARNYLLPQRLGAMPTPENIAAIEEERKHATAERAKRQAEFTKLVDRLEEASVTIEATANPEGTLYGSVGAKEIAAALNAQGFEVLPEHVMLDTPIRTLDNRLVPLEFTDEITAQVKVWVVREGGDEILEDEEPEETPDDEDDDVD